MSNEITEDSITKYLNKLALKLKLYEYEYRYCVEEKCASKIKCNTRLKQNNEYEKCKRCYSMKYDNNSVDCYFNNDYSDKICKLCNEDYEHKRLYKKMMKVATNIKLTRSRLNTIFIKKSELLQK